MSTPVCDIDNDGTWIHPDVSYVEPARIFCTLCGRPIARRYWQSSVDGSAVPFCEPEHAELYRSWWIPVHGAQSNR